MEKGNEGERHTVVYKDCFFLPSLNLLHMLTYVRMWEDAVMALPWTGPDFQTNTWETLCPANFITDV